MVSALQNPNEVALDDVDEAMLLVDPARPDAAAKVLQRFRLAGTGKWRTTHLLDQAQDACCTPGIGLDPIAQVVQSLSA